MSDIRNREYEEERSTFWYRLPPVLRDYLEFIILAATGNDLVAYALHLMMKAEESDFDKGARKSSILMGHMEFFLPWIFGLVFGLLHPALGFLTAYALHLIIKALTLYFVQN